MSKGETHCFLITCSKIVIIYRTKHFHYFTVFFFQGAKQKIEFVGKKGKSMWAIRKIKKNDDEFDVDEFLIFAQDIYVKAHEAMLK